MTIPFLRTPYNYDTNAAGDESGLDCKDPTRTKQSFKEECDINTLVERFSLTGEIPINDRVPLPIDIGTGMDFKDAMNQVVAARESFDQLPAKVRARFKNDPAEFLDHVQDPENVDDLIKWGLAAKRPTEPVANTQPPIPPEPAKKPEQPPEGDKVNTSKGVT